MLYRDDEEYITLYGILTCDNGYDFMTEDVYHKEDYYWDPVLKKTVYDPTGIKRIICYKKLAKNETNEKIKSQYEKILEKYKKDLEIKQNNTALIGKEKQKEETNKNDKTNVSGALNPYTEKADLKAKKVYEDIRKYKKDIQRISKHTKYDVAIIEKIKNYIFIDKHNLATGVKRFAPDYMMSESWNRLTTGQNIQPHDLTLLKHELYEMKLVQNGMSQAKAHIETNKKYNYSLEAKEFYDRHNKH